eukprot:scaffold163_cov229-Prasinococcus_capsulatus_cf.AAC.1
MRPGGAHRKEVGELCKSSSITTIAANVSQSLDPTLIRRPDMGAITEDKPEGLTRSQELPSVTGEKDLMGELSRWTYQHQTRLREIYDEADKARSGLLFSKDLERLAIQ